MYAAVASGTIGDDCVKFGRGGECAGPRANLPRVVVALINAFGYRSRRVVYGELQYCGAIVAVLVAGSACNTVKRRNGIGLTVDRPCVAVAGVNCLYDAGVALHDEVQSCRAVASVSVFETSVVVIAVGAGRCICLSCAISPAVGSE